MADRDPPGWGGFLDSLRALPFVRHLAADRTPEPRTGVDGWVRLETPKRQWTLAVEEKRSHIDRVTVESVVPRLRERTREPLLLFVPYVGEPLAERLAALDINYVDRAGNLRLRLGDEVLVQFGGKRGAPAAPSDKALRGPGWCALFALLTEEGLVDAPVRAIASRALVSKSAAADLLARLRERRLLVETRTRRTFVDRDRLIDELASAYPTVLRPHRLVARFQPPTRTPEETERWLESHLHQYEWVYGGGAACRRLTGFFRGESTVVHLDVHGVPEAPRLIAKELRLAPARTGTLEFVAPPTPVGMLGRQPKIAHELLVYLELAVSPEERAREAAVEVRERFLRRAR